MDYGHFGDGRGGLTVVVIGVIYLVVFKPVVMIVSRHRNCDGGDVEGKV